MKCQGEGKLITWGNIEENSNCTCAPVFQQTDKDAFGCDPFAILHAPTAATLSTHPSAAPPRPESPSPALPPKKSKQPPPRPAPPRPAQGPNIHHSTPAPAATTNDPFAPFNSSNNSSINEFADFSNFNNKVRWSQSSHHSTGVFKVLVFGPWWSVSLNLKSFTPTVGQIYLIKFVLVKMLPSFCGLFLSLEKESQGWEYTSYFNC